MSSLKLSQSEAELLLELLESERQEIFPEIRRADASRLADTLRARLGAIEGLAERIEDLLVRDSPE